MSGVSYEIGHHLYKLNMHVHVLKSIHLCFNPFFMYIFFIVSSDILVKQ